MHTHQLRHRHPGLLLARVVESASRDPASGFFPSERRDSLAVRLLAHFRSIGGSLVGAKIVQAFHYSLSATAWRQGDVSYIVGTYRSTLRCETGAIRPRVIGPTYQ